MKAVELLIQACSEFNKDQERANELFCAAMQCDDSDELSRALSSILSKKGNDIESLSEAASKASKRLRRKPEKTERSFY